VVEHLFYPGLLSPHLTVHNAGNLLIIITKKYQKNGLSLFSTQTSQPKALSDKGFHGTVAPVGSFNTKQGGGVKKSPCIF